MQTTNHAKHRTFVAVFGMAMIFLLLSISSMFPSKLRTLYDGKGDVPASFIVFARVNIDDSAEKFSEYVQVPIGIYSGNGNSDSIAEVESISGVPARVQFSQISLLTSQREFDELSNSTQNAITAVVEPTGRISVSVKRRDGLDNFVYHIVNSGSAVVNPQHFERYRKREYFISVARFLLVSILSAVSLVIVGMFLYLLLKIFRNLHGHRSA